MFLTLTPGSRLSKLVPFARGLQLVGSTTLASAAICDIGAAATTRVSISGTTAINSLGGVPHRFRLVMFQSALTLTYNATSLILPGAANITTAAGDTAVFASDSSGRWYCISYNRASGKTVVALTSSDIPNPVNATVPTTTIYTSGSGTYTVPAGVKWLRIRMVGGGGGGAGSGTGAGYGTAGGNTTFGTSFLTASGGSTANPSNTAIGGGGGGATGGNIANIVGGDGESTNNSGASGPGGLGGTSVFGGAGGNGCCGSGGYGGTGYGSGGGGAGSVSAGVPGGGGGAGGYAEDVISSPSSTYSWAVGAGGTAGAAGTGSGAAPGGAGAPGVIIIEEHYNY